MNRVKTSAGPDKTLGDDQMRVIIAKSRKLIDKGKPGQPHLNEFEDILFYRILSHSDVKSIVPLAQGFAQGMHLSGVFRFCQTNKKSISEWIPVPRPQPEAPDEGFIAQSKTELDQEHDSALEGAHEDV